jgi:hypothetical protein
MKKAYLTLLGVIAGIALLTFASCKMSCVKGSGNQTTTNRKVADFTKVDISGAYKVILKQDSSLGVSVTADDNLQELIKTDVDGNTLKIYTNKKSICASGDFVVTIGVRHLEAVETSGAISVTSEGKITAKAFDLDLSGATKINLDLDAATVHTEASGVTEITLRGQARTHDINLSGGGKVHAFDFIVGDYDITTSGASECEINVLHELTVNSSGASSINYKGSPTAINNKKAGVSSITKVN